MDETAQTLEIHIAFDTNRVWTDSESELIAPAVAKAIKETRALTYPLVRWHLLEITREEKKPVNTHTQYLCVSLNFFRAKF